MVRPSCIIAHGVKVWGAIRSCVMQSVFGQQGPYISENKSSSGGAISQCHGGGGYQDKNEKTRKRKLMKN